LRNPRGRFGKLGQALPRNLVRRDHRQPLGEEMIRAKWDARIARARELAITYPSAPQALRFYEHIAGFQKSLYSQLEKESGTERAPRLPGTLRQELDLFLLPPHFAPFLGIVEANAPAVLADAAAKFRSAGAKQWQSQLESFWHGNSQHSDSDHES